jgi:beta-glucosidase
MKRAGLAVLALAGVATVAGCTSDLEQPELGLRSKSVVEAEGYRFRDLDGDGKLTPYEDWRLDADQRAQDLASRMTLAEKVGMLMHSTLPGKGGLLGRADGYDLEALGPLLREKHVTSYITRLVLPPADLARQNNAVQAMAENTRLGIPVTISSDPRNHFQYVLGAGDSANGVTQWPELLGFAALRDPALVEQFGNIARKEYRAVGIHMALSPQLDLLTEPRWPRGAGTFGSDPVLASELGKAYVAGLQGGEAGLARDGVMTIVKHWVGYGAQPNGFDAHNYYGRFAQVGDRLDLHAQAFRGAFEANAAGVMPAYPILLGTDPDGRPLEQVGPGFSKQLLQDRLRGREGFDGLILSDWAITRDCTAGCRNPTSAAPQQPQDIATSWGVEDLSVDQRYVKGLEAGLDQFGGTGEVQPLIDAAERREIRETRIDESVRRILLGKFQQGLFENPYVDPEAAASAVGTPANMALAQKTQREAQVLLENRASFLPVASTMRKVWLFGMAPEAARQAGLTVVDDPADADFAIVRTEAPSEMLHPNHFFGSRQKEGRLDFRAGDPAFDALERASASVPTILAIFLDRPAILTNVQNKASAILANYGASDAAVLDVVLGRARAKGRLPSELPRSMDAVEAQDPALPDDSRDPLYPRGTSVSDTADIG